MEKRVYRSNTEKMIAGVAGGIAEYFEVDPVLVRVAFVITAFFNGIGVIAYIACIFIIPKAPLHIPQQFGETGDAAPELKAEPPAELVAKKKEGRHQIFGWILVILGGVLLLENYFCFFDLEYIFPIILILAGFWLISFNRRKGATANDLR